MDNSVTLKITIDSRRATKQLQRATIAAEELSIQLEKLKNIEIGINTVEIKPKWWQFWKNIA